MLPDEDSRARVSSYLEGLEHGADNARRSRTVAIGAGLALGAVGVLTSIGIVPAEARALVASASVVAVGFAMSRA